MREGLILLLLVAAACGVDRDVEHRVTITTGVYGQTTSSSDVGSDRGPHYYQMDIELRDHTDARLAQARSGEQGFYELAAVPADYRICSSFGRCTDITIAANQRLRCDYEFTLGGGWSCMPAR